MRFSLILVFLVVSCGLYPEPNALQSPKGMALRAFERDLGMLGGKEGDMEDVVHLAPLSEDQIQAYIREDRDADRKILSIREKNKELALSNLPRDESRVGRLARAKGLRLLGRSLEARTLLEGILKEDPNFFPATHVLAWDAFKRGDLREARKGFREVVFREPGHVSAQMGLARCLFASSKEKDHREAGRILQGLMKNPRGGISAAREWILELLRLGEPKKALSVVKDAQKRFPGEEIFRLYEAQAHFDLGDFEAAAKVAQPLAEKPGPLQAAALHWRFMALRAMRDFDGALKTYSILKDGNFQDFIMSIGKGFFLETEAILKKEKRLGRRVSFDPLEVQVQVQRNQDPELRKLFLSTLAQVRNPDQKISIDRTITWVLKHDPSLGLRKLALAILQQRNPGKLKPILLGLQAKAPVLRKAALSLMVTLPVRVALPKLLSHLGREEDPEVFRRAHEILLRLSGKDVYLPPGVEETPEGRAKIRKEWRHAFSGN
jgi:tetratricopeptide (TPR) repeat protein